MTKVIVEKPFTSYMSGEDAELDCILHWVEIDSEDATDETVGTFCFTIEGSKHHVETEFAIWGSSDGPNAWHDTYICFPNYIEEEEGEYEDEEDYLEVIFLPDALHGLVEFEELGI